MVVLLKVWLLLVLVFIVRLRLILWLRGLFDAVVFRMRAVPGFPLAGASRGMWHRPVAC